MAENIIARLSSSQPDLCVQWLLITDATPSELRQGTLQELADYAKNEPITLLLPASYVLLLALDLPVKTSSQIKKALPFALDDLLADDVEAYHLLWHRQPNNKVYVAAISHDKFQAYLSPFQAVGIELDAVYPETLCLPFEDRSCSILIDQQNAVLRSGQWLGGGIDAEVLPAFVAMLLEENPQLEHLQVWNAGTTAHRLSELPIHQIVHVQDSPLKILQAGAIKLNEECNLLSGRYRRKTETTWQWQKGLPALGIILVAVLIQTVVMLNGYWKQKSELATLETQTMTLFKQTFPEVHRIVNIKAQAEQQLTELKKQSSVNGSRFMSLLYHSGEVLSTNPDFKLRQLEFVNDMLQLQLTAPDISQVEQFKQQLESSHELSVKIQSAEAGQNTVEAHLEIRQN
jgi:general secretion pathway protein L